MSLLGQYVPGTTVVHRVPAGAKLLGLVGLAVLAQLLRVWWQDVLLLAAVLVLYPVAGLPLRRALGQLRALWWVLAAVAVAQVLLATWPAAVSVVATLLLLVLAAGLITLTTTTTAMSEVVVRLLGPFRRFGIAPERVGLLLALSIRAIPVVLGLAEEIRDAQRARGLPTSPRAFAVPLLVRALRHAQRMGDALVARGLDD